MKVKIKNVITAIEDTAPLVWQESYDNSGLLLGDTDRQVSGIYICLDISIDIVNEALAKGCNMIISHHPLVFKQIKKIDYTSNVGKIIVKSIKNDLTLYSAHTNMDNAVNGVNGALAQKLGLTNTQSLCDERLFSHENYLGAGLIGQIQPIEVKDFLSKVKQILSLPCIKHNKPISETINKVAICGGSGSFLFEQAKAKQADIFLTADIKYHDFLDNEGSLFIADIGHFESEQFIKQRINELLTEKFSNFVPLFLDKRNNRVEYF
jgi:dinuclear metal center protein, YbgI/SA1388 family